MVDEAVCVCLPNVKFPFSEKYVIFCCVRGGVRIDVPHVSLHSTSIADLEFLQQHIWQQAIWQQALITFP